MFASYSSPSQAYARVGVETGVMAADPHRLVLMLFDGALVATGSAEHALQTQDLPAKGRAVAKAVDIVTNGLKASLDFSAGGDLAHRLAALYDYICARLLQGNLHNDAAAFAEARSLLGELKSAWQEIAGDPAVVSASTTTR